MKKLLASLLILVQIFILCPMQTVAEETTTVIVHYKEAEGNDKDWNLWIWPAGGEGSAYDFTGEDNFGKVATITLPGQVDKAGFIVRTDSWEKDTPNDRFIEQFNNGVGEIWIIGGQEEFYYENPEGPDEIVDEEVLLQVNYHNYDMIYDDISAKVYFTEEIGQTLSFTDANEFGVTGELLVKDTKGQGKIIVDILSGNSVVATYDVKKIYDGKANVFLVENDERTYYSQEDAVYQPTIVKGKLEDTKTIAIETNMLFKATKDLVEVKVNGEVIEVAAINFAEKNGFLETVGTITLKNGVNYTDDIFVTLPMFEPAKIQLGDVYDTLEFNSLYNYDGLLGPIYTKERTTFKVWAPTAQDINLALFEDHKSEPTVTFEMTRSEQGVWETTVEGDLHNQLYAYEVQLSSDYEYVVDPYAKGVSVNGIRSAVIDLERINPENWDEAYKTNFTNATDAIMYEIHVRDLSMQRQSGIENKGKFLGFTERNTTNPNGFSTGLDYIKELGVTHIQLLPIYDYGSINEEKDEVAFNWGYDPVNYNALEGSYSTDAFTPDVRINEFKQAVQAIHDAGLKVTMDVVYNHVYSVNAMAFEKLVPGYYFRKEGENFANGSGCGNETASDRYMMHKFMVDSTRYLVEEYNLDGFRFDLMGLHDVETMNAIRTSLNEVDPSITIIGEGWNMGNVLAEDKKANQNQAHLMPGIAHFNDTIRDGLKGSVFDQLDQGFVNGKPAMESTVFSGIVGGIHFNDIKTWGDIEPNQSVTYVEAHDNNTLYDKLKISNPDASPADIKRMHTLADSIVLTSQGIPFIHAGQEFMRTKLGDENSYKSSDIVNRLDWMRRETYNDLVEYFKVLIEMRKAHPSFRLSSKEDILNKMTSLQLDDNVIAYQLQNDEDSWKNIVVIHNAATEDSVVSLPTEGVWQVVVKDGQANLEGLEKISRNKVKVPKISTMVLYQSGTKADAFNQTTLIFIIVGIAVVGAVVLFMSKKKKQ